MRIDQQLHGYSNGHKLLASSVSLDKRDQELINRLSDVSGPLGPGETFEPYLTGYRLPLGSFVLARTRLDLAARRAGCVETRSLIIRLEDWAHGSPSGLAALLEQVFEAPVEPIELTAKPEPIALPPVTSGGTSALVEAVFLEQRKPLVCFRERSAETVLLRLLEALWPSFRQSLSFCTFALQPRALEGQPFDLLFAPRGARSRFSNWPGRKLDIESNAEAPRHAWTGDLVQSIFLNPRPTLGTFDRLGLIDRDRSGGAKALRLALLWRDLEDESRSDPRAVLGLMDVLSAAALPREKAEKETERLFAQATQLLARPSSANEATDLLNLLVAKLPPDVVSESTRDQATRTATKIVSADPRSAVRLFHLVDETPLGTALAKGIGDGLGEAENELGALEALQEGADPLLTEMLASSPSLVRLVMRPEGLHSGAVERLAEAMGHASPGQMSALRETLPELIALPDHAQLIAGLVRHASSLEVARVLQGLKRHPSLLESEVVRAQLARALLPEHARTLRAMIVTLPDREELDSLLCQTLSSSAEDFDWILTGEGLADRRRRTLLAAFLSRLDELDLEQVIAQRPQETEKALQLLLDEGGEQPSFACARILASQPQLSLKFGERIEGLLDLVPKPLGLKLVASVLPALLSPQDRDRSKQIESLLSRPTTVKLLRELPTEQLVDAVFPARMSSSDWARQLKCVKVLLGFPKNHPLPLALIFLADEVSKKFEQAPLSAVDAEFLEIWANLLSAAVSGSSHNSYDAAAIALGFVLRHPVPEAASLAFTAFPLVLWREEQPKNPIDYWSRVFGFEIETAKDLRERVVGAYIKGGWPASDLMVGALKADVHEKVIRMLKRTQRGADLLGSAVTSIRTRADLSGTAARMISDLIAGELGRR